MTWRVPTIKQALYWLVAGLSVVVAWLVGSLLTGLEILPMFAQSPLGSSNGGPTRSRFPCWLRSAFSWPRCDHRGARGTKGLHCSGERSRSAPSSRDAVGGRTARPATGQAVC